LTATVLPRELEGALALLVVVSTQMLADPAGSIAPWLPFWSTRDQPAWSMVGHRSACGHFMRYLRR